MRFIARGLGYSLFLTPEAAVLRLPGQGSDAGAVLRMALEGANAAPRMAGHGQQPGASHHYRGADPSQWRQASRYSRVSYDEVYPGIDLVYYGNNRQLEYDFIVAPGRDPDRIVMRFDGASPKVDADGKLVLTTPQGAQLQQREPVLYQDIAGRRVAVQGRYRLLGDNRVGFAVGAHDPAHALVIDPVIDYSGWLEASESDWATGMAVDRAGNVYLTGRTLSSDFPTTVTGDAPGPLDAFVTRINAAGNALTFSAYIGSWFSDEANAIAVDAAGSMYITGSTRGSATSTPAFPLVNAIQTANAGFDDAWVMKLNAAGSIVYSTLLGGTMFDFGQAIAVDASGQAYVAGTTQSVDFPTKAARQPANGGGGNRDAFLFKLNAAGGLIFSTYHGGAQTDYGTGVALDAAGNAYVSGYTDSTNFPLVNARQPVYGGYQDAFLSKFNAAGSALLFSTYHGGNSTDYGYAVAVDRTGAAYLTGSTGSSNFPLLNAFQTVSANSASHEVFVSKFVPAGTAFGYSTLLGGNGHDYAYAIAVDAAGNAYVTGHTSSSNLPQAARVQPGASGDGYDAFVAKIAVVSGRASLAFSSYLGGTTARESGRAVAVDRFGGVYVAGEELEPANSSLNEVIMARLAQPMNRSWTGDFDGDGKDDILWRNLRTGGNDLWRQGNSALRIALSAVADVNWTVGGVGDFNGDGKADILWRNLVTGSNELWRSGLVAQRQVIGGVSDTNWVVAGIGDFTGDAKADILWRNRVTGGNVMWPAANAATPTTLTAVAALKWEVVGIGDFNHDGRDDVLWRDTEAGANVVWRSANAATQQALTSVANRAARVDQVADFTGDGYADILWRTIDTGSSTLWRSGNSATWGTVGNVPLVWRQVGSGDYDGNGKADILWRNTQTGGNEVWGGASSAARRVLTTVADVAWTPANP
ncbi:DUF7948 domain-containing protein [Agrilutibacter solisilvae]|uniref:SBBP repeat-containing protein n=1 Tax=Agrilutibacter solisilvae TaxID=2763317 RepID=A0A975ASU7_9GAMM|nr:SBBP repeat-containing protein [Lysobacter solisilvae]QSX79147.1 SBBP repeat-containing protein [Lysobacter solisilvae]